MAILRRWWDRYRHFKAAQVLAQDVIGWLGWKKAVSSLAVAVITGIKSRSTHLAAVETFVLSLCAFAAVLLILNVAPRALSEMRGIRWRGVPPGLAFACVDGASSRGIPRWCDGVVTIVEVRNEFHEQAKNVQARLQYSSARGTRLPMSSAAWCFVPDQRGSHARGFLRTLDLESSETQAFVLFVSKEDGRFWIHADDGAPVGPLDYDEWEALVTVTSDNVRGFEGNLKFKLSKFAGFQRAQPMFTMRRSLPPRFQPA